MSDKSENLGVIYRKSDYAGFLKRMIITIVDLIVIIIVLICSLFVSGYFIFDSDV